MSDEPQNFDAPQAAPVPTPAPQQAPTDQAQDQAQGQVQDPNQGNLDQSHQVAHALHAEIQRHRQAGNVPPGAAAAPSLGGFVQSVLTNLNLTPQEKAALYGLPQKVIQAIILGAVAQGGIHF